MRDGRRDNGAALFAALALAGIGYAMVAAWVWYADRVSAQVFGSAWDVSMALHAAMGLVACGAGVVGFTRAR